MGVIAIDGDVEFGAPSGRDHGDDRQDEKRSLHDLRRRFCSSRNEAGRDFSQSTETTRMPILFQTMAESALWACAMKRMLAVMIKVPMTKNAVIIATISPDVLS